MTDTNNQNPIKSKSTKKTNEPTGRKMNPIPKEIIQLINHYHTPEDDQRNI